MEFLKRWWVTLALGVLIGLCVLEALLLAKGGASGKGWIVGMFDAVAPNLIADLITVLIGYAIFRFTAQDHYVETMKAVRAAVQKIPTNLQLRPEQVQALMEGMVPIVSKLYFKDGGPTSREAKRDLVYRTTCQSCSQVCLVKEGRCAERCSDIPESWAGQRLELVSETPRNPHTAA